MNRVGFGRRKADAAADMGRRHQTEDVMEERRALLIAREFWYPVMLQLHRLLVAVSQFFGLIGFLDGPWIQYLGGAFLVLTLLPGLKVLTWLVGVILSLLLCFGPLGCRDMGHFGISYLVGVIVFEMDTVCSVRKLLVPTFVRNSAGLSLYQ